MVNKRKIDKRRMYYFAYGSNLNLSQMYKRCTSARLEYQGYLPHYDMEFLGSNRRGNGVMNIYPSEGKDIYGAIFSITKSDLKALDIYEGYPSLYIRKEIPIKIIGDDGDLTGELSCITYFMNKDMNKFKMCPPSEYYFLTILQGYKDCCLPNTNYMKHIRTNFKISIEV